MTRIAWQFYDPVSFASYTFEINPSPGGDAADPAYAKVMSLAVSTRYGPILETAQDVTMTGKFAGVILTQTQYQAFAAWVANGSVIRLTDDLGRMQMVLLTDFTAKRIRCDQYPWRHTYDMTYLVQALADV